VEAKDSVLVELSSLCERNRHMIKSMKISKSVFDELLWDLHEKRRLLGYMGLIPSDDIYSPWKRVTIHGIEITHD
jgi:hypothetical protein